MAEDALDQLFHAAAADIESTRKNRVNSALDRLGSCDPTCEQHRHESAVQASEAALDRLSGKVSNAGSSRRRKIK